MIQPKKLKYFHRFLGHHGKLGVPFYSTADSYNSYVSYSSSEVNAGPKTKHNWSFLEPLTFSQHSIVSNHCSVVALIAFNVRSECTRAADIARVYCVRTKIDF